MIGLPNALRRLRFAISVAMLFGLLYAGIVPESVQAGSNGQMIDFNLSGGAKFTYLRIEGTNHNGKVVNWEKTFNQPGVSSWIIDRWWWKGTLLLEFEIVGQGRAACIVDYVPEKQQNSDYFLITYYGRGGGCSSAGSAQEIGGLFNRKTIAVTLENYILYKSNIQMTENLKLALKRDVLGIVGNLIYEPACFLAILAALPQNPSAIPLRPNTAQSCKNEISVTEAVLIRYGNPPLLRAK